MRVLVTGSRDLDDYRVVADLLDYYIFELNDGRTFTVVHGKNPKGADLFASQWCQRALPEWDVVEEAHPANWSKGKIAGIQRNQKMVALGADICLAFPRGRSPGTRDCIMRAEAYMIPVVLG